MNQESQVQGKPIRPHKAYGLGFTVQVCLDTCEAL